MGFTTIAYYDDAAHTTLAITPYLADTSMTPTGNGFVVPSGMNYLSGAYVLGAKSVRGMFAAPSLRKYAYHYIKPVNDAVNPSTATPWIDAFASPIPITVNDELDALEDNNGNAEDTVVIAWLSSGPIQPVTGQMFTVEATSAKTTVAFEWTACPLVFTTSLEFDQYDIVGLYAESEDMIAARVLIPGFPWRPGCIGAALDNTMTPERFRYGRAGIWATFAQTTPPQIEVLTNDVDSAETFYLDLIKH